MTATQRDKRPEAPEPDPATGLGEHVMRILGRPTEAHRVVVRKLWAGHYRVNVLLGTDITSITIAHSFFVVTDDDGKVTATNPVIKRRYMPPAA